LNSSKEKDISVFQRNFGYDKDFYQFLYRTLNIHFFANNKFKVKVGSNIDKNYDCILNGLLLKKFGTIKKGEEISLVTYK